MDSQNLKQGVAEASTYNHTNRWEHEELLEKGYVPVPNTFLQLYAQLKPSLTTGEALFIVQLMSFKWDKKAPFPSYGTIAERMGISDKMARRHAASLENKGYLYRVMRTGGTNKFVLTKLFNALVNLQHDQKYGNTDLFIKD